MADDLESLEGDEVSIAEEVPYSLVENIGSEILPTMKEIAVHRHNATFIRKLKLGECSLLWIW